MAVICPTLFRSKRPEVAIELDSRITFARLVRELDLDFHGIQTAPLLSFQIGEFDMPVKKRTSKTKATPKVIVRNFDYEFKKDGGGFFLTDHVAEAFGRHALITYCDVKELLKAYS